MSHEQPKNPLHGITLQAMLEDLLERYGWDGLAERIDVRCFTYDPSMKSSLKFLRRTEWARRLVEALYLETVAEDAASRRGTAAPNSTSNAK